MSRRCLTLCLSLLLLVSLGVARRAIDITAPGGGAATAGMIYTQDCEVDPTDPWIDQSDGNGSVVEEGDTGECRFNVATNNDFSSISTGPLATTKVFCAFKVTRVNSSIGFFCQFYADDVADAPSNHYDMGWSLNTTPKKLRLWHQDDSDDNHESVTLLIASGAVVPGGPSSGCGCDLNSVPVVDECVGATLEGTSISGGLTAKWYNLGSACLDLSKPSLWAPADCTCTATHIQDSDLTDTSLTYSGNCGFTGFSTSTNNGIEPLMDDGECGDWN